MLNVGWSRHLKVGGRMLQMSTTKAICLIAHRNNTCKVLLVSSLFLVPCGFCCEKLKLPKASPPNII